MAVARAAAPISAILKNPKKTFRLNLVSVLIARNVVKCTLSFVLGDHSGYEAVLDITG